MHRWVVPVGTVSKSSILNIGCHRFVRMLLGHIATWLSINAAIRPRSLGIHPNTSNVPVVHGKVIQLDVKRQT